MKSLPIEIIGGGLAGLSLGLALRDRGVAVTLFEAGDYPRHRVCGEFIAGLSDDTVNQLGIASFLDDALLHREVAWFIDGRCVRHQHLPSPARALSRHRLDARLATAFVAAGGQLKTNTRVATDKINEGCVVTTGRRRAQSKWIGLKIHALNLSLERDLELHLGTDAYIGLTRVEDGRVNICGLFRRRSLSFKGAALIISYLNATNLSALAQRLIAASLDENSFSAVAAVDFDQHVTASEQIALGDACAMIPPFTGNGMAMAFQSSAAALNPLVAYSRGDASWLETCATIRQALQRQFRVRLATADVVHPFLLNPKHQRWLTRFARARLLPFRPLYSLLH